MAQGGECYGLGMFGTRWVLCVCPCMSLHVCMSDVYRCLTSRLQLLPIQRPAFHVCPCKLMCFLWQSDSLCFVLPSPFLFLVQVSCGFNWKVPPTQLCLSVLARISPHCGQCCFVMTVFTFFSHLEWGFLLLKLLNLPSVLPVLCCIWLSLIRCNTLLWDLAVTLFGDFVWLYGDTFCVRLLIPFFHSLTAAPASSVGCRIVCCVHLVHLAFISTVPFLFLKFTFICPTMGKLFSAFDPSPGGSGELRNSHAR